MKNPKEIISGLGGQYSPAYPIFLNRNPNRDFVGFQIENSTKSNSV
jgi:hypothetical protein